MANYEIGQIRTDRGLFVDKGNYGIDPRHPDFSGGARGDGVYDDRRAIADADAYAVSVGAQLVFGIGTYHIASTITITSPVVLPAGAVLKPASGVTVTFSAAVDAAADTGCFNTSAGGSFVFNTPSDERRLANLLVSGGGIVITGTVTGMPNTYRTDAALTVTQSGNAHAMIDIYHSRTGVSGGAGGAGGEESVVNFSMKDAGGNPQQLGSVSMIWADATAGTGRSMVRIHANKLGGGSNSDFRLTGDGGIEFFGTSDTTWPGPGVVQITNGSLKLSGTGVSGVMSIFAAANILTFQAGTSGYLFQNSANTVSLITQTDSGPFTLANGVKVTGGAAGVATIYNSGNRLILQCDTSGYLFQNSTNGATLLAMTDSGAATFSNGVKVTGAVAGVSTIYNTSNKLVFQADTNGFLFQNSGNTTTLVSLSDAGLMVTTASATGNAGFRLPHGTAPSSPVDGDMWTTTAGLYVRINGSTVGPLT